MFSFTLSFLALAQVALAVPRPDLGPQYYGPSTYEANGTTFTTLVPVSSTPVYEWTTSTATTSTTKSTETLYSTSTSVIEEIVPVPYVYAVTVYYTSTSSYTSYTTTASTETAYKTFESEITSYSASTTTWMPVCSGTLTETTTTIIADGPTFTLGTTVVSALVLETYYISGISTSVDYYTTTTTTYVPGPPHPQVTTAPTIIHTGAHTLTFPCATITVTETLSYDPVVQTAIEQRRTVATTFFSSESWTTALATYASTNTEYQTLLSAYTSTYLVRQPVAFSGSSVTTISTSTSEVVYAATSTAEVMIVKSESEMVANVYHLTAGIGFTSTYLVSGTTIVVEGSASTPITVSAPVSTTVLESETIVVVPTTLVASVSTSTVPTSTVTSVPTTIVSSTVTASSTTTAASSSSASLPSATQVSEGVKKNSVFGTIAIAAVGVLVFLL